MVQRLLNQVPINNIISSFTSRAARKTASETIISHNRAGFPLLTPIMETYDGPAWRLIATSFVFSPKHRGALDCLPFQGFARRSGIQVFRLYSRASPVTEIAMEAGRQGRTRMEGGKAHRKCVRCMRGLCCGFVIDDVDSLMIQHQVPKCSRPFQLNLLYWGIFQ